MTMNPREPDRAEFEEPTGLAETGMETPTDDAVWQHADVLPAEYATEEAEEAAEAAAVEEDVNPVDAVEQTRLVELDEDDYR